MWLNWLPWRFVVSYFARAHGFIDPVAVLSHLHRFAQPSEVQEPIELLRAGVIFQARGLLNTRAIQHNLDWVWPYWIERQFDPHDVAFVPRAFSVTHVNLTHRNWTAIGRPDCPYLPIVDPRGLVTPLMDSWSLDFWLLPEHGPALLPSRLASVDQRMSGSRDLAVETAATLDGHALRSVADVGWRREGPCCRVRLEARSTTPGWLVVAIRPANPEGVSFIHGLELTADRSSILVNERSRVLLGAAPQRVGMSVYLCGDIAQYLPTAPETRRVRCEIGMATAAALYPVRPGAACELTVEVPLEGSASHPAEPPEQPDPRDLRPIEWADALDGLCTLDVPDARHVFLFENAVRNLVLFSPGDVYPGPYTWKRFWFRDAAFILHALLVVGAARRVRRVLDRYPARQRHDGYFRSQEGEWDSNGAALWILDRYRRLAGVEPGDDLLAAMLRGADWIRRKRVARELDAPHAGLLPAGFSAEHLGPNDHYFWDDFWAAGGLRAAAATLRARGDRALAAEYEDEAADLLECIDRAIACRAAHRRRPGVPASPYRRMDSGAIGSLAGGYPLQLWRPADPRLIATVEFLLENCLVAGGFFQDMIHSGVNAYLTLHVAQVLLRAGDARHLDLTERIAELASPTGNWPEAVHPHTGGGCMGDGQHMWAAAEWVLITRNAFVREEGDELIVGAGLPRAWLAGPAALRFGPVWTERGPLTLRLDPQPGSVRVSWEAEWRPAVPNLKLCLPGCRPLTVSGTAACAHVPRLSADHPVGAQA